MPLLTPSPPPHPPPSPLHAVRHILKTLALSRRHKERPLAFYLHENSLECLARDLLLLHITFDNDTSIMERTHLYLEVFANTLVKDRTEIYIAEAAGKLIKLLTDGEGVLSEYVDFSLLKHKDRDGLENIFKFWTETRPFDMHGIRDSRRRKYYDARYDARSNVDDWDYNMKMTDYEPHLKIVHTIQWKDWRDRGVAYEWGVGGEYRAPNRTLATEILMSKADGTGAMSRGVWCDIVSSPYMCWGFHVPEHAKELFKTYSSTHIKSTQDVSEFNVFSTIQELLTGVEYKIKEKIEPHHDFLFPDEGLAPIALPDFKIYPMGPESSVPLTTTYTKKRFKGLFHRVVIGNVAASYVGFDLSAIMQPKCLLSVETGKLVLEFLKAQMIEFEEAVMKRGTDAGWTPITGLAPHWTKVVEKEKEKDDTSRLNTNHAAYKLAPENTRPIQCHFWYQQGEALATATRLKEEADAKTAAEQALADEQLRKNAAAKQEADAVTAKAESRELRKLADERRRLAEVKAKERCAMELHEVRTVFPFASPLLCHHSSCLPRLLCLLAVIRQLTLPLPLLSQYCHTGRPSVPKQRPRSSLRPPRR